MLAIDGQDGDIILPSKLADECASHNERLFVGEQNLLVGLDGVDGGREPGKSHHCRDNAIDGVGLHNLVYGLLACIDFDVGQVGEQCAQLLVVCFVGDDYCCRLELPCLLRQKFHAIVGCECVYLVSVAVLLDDIEGLCSDGTCAAEDAYLLFVHIWIDVGVSIMSGDRRAGA